MGYMRTATVYINEGHPLFKYADNLTALKIGRAHV